MDAESLRNELVISTTNPGLKAAGGFYWTGTVLNKYNLFNCNVVRGGVGSYTVTFTNPLVDGNYLVTFGFRRVGTSDFAQYYNAVSASFVIEFWSSGVIAENTQRINFLVF